ncbi:MAG: single-stranded-DNA-specific exonuclease RecJ [Betaproteobacteria bacterium]
MDIVRRLVPESARALVAAGVSPLLSRIYAARGVVDVTELDCSLERLPHWSMLLGAKAAAVRLADGIARGERMTIVADYDADGATACAVGVRGLSAMGAMVDFLVPNRFEHGYGLTPEIVALAAARAPGLIITVDNGIASVDGVAAANARGIEVLITDHHLPGDTLPAPAWIVNPNQAGCTFPSKHLAGVGVMFYVLTALRAQLRERGHFATRPEPNLGVLLDLVALGTVADVVRLDHANRVLVDNGLRRIRAGRMQPGLRALFAVAGKDPRHATTYDLGFVAGPRLNASGRMADISTGIACLLADDEATATRLAGELDRLNSERRAREATMQEQALAAIDTISAGDAFTLCAYRPDWHQGVVGLVASRLKDRFHRPAMVFAPGIGEELRGSGRTIAGFHLRDALDLVAKRAPGTITRFGGHAFAAGLTLPRAHLTRFTEEFERVGREWLTLEALHQTLDSDGELSADELTFELADTLSGGVWGQGFPAPVFDGAFTVAGQRQVGAKHTRLLLIHDRQRLEAIAFNEPGPLPERLRVRYRPGISRFQGQCSLELLIESWQPA